MLFGVKANVGSNPTVTANEKGPGSLVNKGKQGLLLTLGRASGNAAVTKSSQRSVFSLAPSANDSFTWLCLYATRLPENSPSTGTFCRRNENVGHAPTKPQRSAPEARATGRPGAEGARFRWNSYAHEDADLAEGLKIELAGRVLEVRIDQERLKLGRLQAQRCST